MRCLFLSVDNVQNQNNEETPYPWFAPGAPKVLHLLCRALNLSPENTLSFYPYKEVEGTGSDCHAPRPINVPTERDDGKVWRGVRGPIPGGSGQ